MQPISHLRGDFGGACCALALAAAAALPGRAHAQAPAATPAPPTASAPGAQAAAYLNGGIGLDEQQSMKQVAHEWPLRLTFSEHRDNLFVAGVHLLVTDRQGRPWLQLADAGPMTYLRLPPGAYRVSARHRGVTQTREVTVGAARGVDLAFHWQLPQP